MNGLMNQMEKISLASMNVLVLVLLVNQARGSEECTSLDFTRRANQALTGHTFKTLQLDVQQCMTECAKSVGCFSINTYQNGSGVQQCELLRSTAKASRRNLAVKPGYEYSELTGYDLPHCLIDKKALPDGSYRLMASLYKLHPIRKTWAAAKDFCVSLGGNLASVNSETENKFLQQTMAFRMNFDALPAFPWSSLLAHWKLDGEDKNGLVSLSGGPFYERFNGVTTLHMPSSGHAQIPAVDISTTSFTLGIWVYHQHNGHYHVILGDWSSPHKFRWEITPSDKLWMILRTPSSQDLLSGGSFGSVPRNQWVHLGFSWNRDTAEAKYYVDGVVKGSTPANPGLGLDLMSNDHSVYEIGVKKDSGANVFYGYMRDLHVFGKALTDKEMLVVRNSFDATSGTWIGLNDVSNEGTFVWSDNSARKTYTEWTPGEPNNEFSLQDCVAMTRDGEWEDKLCDMEMPFICETAA